MGVRFVLLMWIVSQLGDFPPGFGRRAPNQALPPGVTLLPGFVHERYQTPDSIHGRIWNDQKLDIRYDWGLGVPNRVVRESSNLLWSREQIVDRYRIQVAMSRNRILMVTFTPAEQSDLTRTLSTNFYAVTDSDEDVADMLLMTMAFRGGRP